MPRRPDCPSCTSRASAISLARLVPAGRFLWAGRREDPTEPAAESRRPVRSRRQAVPADPERNNIAPRIGFAWTPGGKTVVRGGAGLYYSQINAQIANLLATLDGQQIQQAAITARGIPGLTPARPQRSRPRDFRHRDDYVNPYSQQASLEIERAFGDFAVSAALFTGGTRLPRCSTGTSTSPGRSPTGSRCTGSSIRRSSSTTSRSRPVVLSCRDPAADQALQPPLLLSANYTFAKAIDDVTDFLGT